MANYKSIKDPGSANRMGGTQQYILVAPYGDFNVLQKPVDGAVAILVAHTFLATKGFIKLYLTQDTGNVKFGTQGGDDRKSFRPEGEFYHPGESDEIVNFANKAKNDRFIVLVPLPGSTEFIQIGNEEFQVNIAPEYDTAKNSGDGRGWTFKMSAFAADMIKYRSTVTLLADPV